MPNFETEVKKNLDQKIKAMEKGGLGTKPVFKEYIEKLKALNELTKEQYEKDEYGLDKSLTPEKLKEFKTLYAESGKIGEKLLFAYSKFKGEAGYKVIESVNNLLSSDMKILNGVDEKTLEDENISIQMIVDASRKKTVDISGKNLGTVGASLSSRIPFNHVEGDGKEMPGVFTPNKPLDMEASYNKMMTKLNAISPELADAINQGVNKYMDGEMDKVLSGTSDRTRGEMQFRGIYQMMEYGILTKDSIAAGLKDLTAEGHQKYMDFLQTDGAEAKLKAGMKELMQFYQENALPHIAAGIRDKSRVDSRNSAMSRVAELLQVPNLICKSVPMKVVKDGKEIEGTFMGLAEGVDVMTPSKECFDVAYSAQGPVFSQSNGLKDVADLQILDFVCGNVDRHGGNMFYKFDSKDPNPFNHKFTGVQGIDNDCSFGTFVPKGEDDSSYARLRSLNSLKVMSSSMAKNIMCLNKEMLSFTLRDQGLSNEQIDAAGKRLDMLHNYIKKSVEAYNNMNFDQKSKMNKDPNYVLPGTVKIVSDNDFRKLNVNKLYTQKHPNTFAFVANFQNICRSSVAKNPDRQAISPQKIEEKQFFSIKEEELEWSRNLVRKLNSATQENRTSEQYKKVQEAAEKYKEYCEKNKGAVLTEQDYEIRKGYLKKITEAAKGYVDYKKSAFFKNSYTKNRIATVTSILNETEPKAKENFYRDLKKSMSKEDYRRYADGLHAAADRNMDKFNANMRKVSANIIKSIPEKTNNPKTVEQKQPELNQPQVKKQGIVKGF